jgi:hypothetical protein
MHALRTNKVAGRATTRSKVSNGTLLFANIDGRTSSARRFRDLVQNFEAEFDGDLCEAAISANPQSANPPGRRCRNTSPSVQRAQLMRRRLPPTHKQPRRDR